MTRVPLDAQAVLNFTGPGLSAASFDTTKFTVVVAENLQVSQSDITDVVATDANAMAPRLSRRALAAVATVNVAFSVSAYDYQVWGRQGH